MIVFRHGLHCSYVDRLIASKSDIERQLLKNDQKCQERCETGIDLLANVIAANDDRERKLHITNVERFQSMDYYGMKANDRILHRDTNNYVHNFASIELTEEIRADQIASEEKVETITAQWSALEDVKNPFDLNDALDKQKEKIATVLALKNRSIQLLRDEIDRLHKIFYENSHRQVSFH